ncbi:hypothetical protein LCGC14_2474150 [marine sediment metagenome]|uniref:Uncharacterized protein n=1 Tax=marine sediment metagenome TaxID=412755 RepID=A0A0F9DLL4_9ZZZZ
MPSDCPGLRELIDNLTERLDFHANAMTLTEELSRGWRGRDNRRMEAMEARIAEIEKNFHTKEAK